MKLTTIIILSLLIILLFGQFTIKWSTNKTEQPTYELIKKFKKFEIRSYPELILAQTKLNSSDYSKNSGKGFRSIAGYIFGGNDENKKIAMTSPVIAEMKDSMVMSFIMPSKFTIDELPKPKNRNVKIYKRNSMNLAVITFGGFANNNDIRNHTQWLKESLYAEGIEYLDNVFFHGYNPPYELFGRKNEVAIELKN